METVNPGINKNREFFEALKASNMKTMGWDLLILYTWAFEESGEFTNMLTLKANNCFSVSYWPNEGWDGEVINNQGNLEEVNGKLENIPALFCKYPDFGVTLKDLLRYLGIHHPNALPYRGQYKLFYHALQTADKYPYATGTGYDGMMKLKYEIFREQNNGELYEALMG